MSFVMANRIHCHWTYLALHLLLSFLWLMINT